MTDLKTQWYKEALCCPDCLSDLALSAETISCSTCRYISPVHSEAIPLYPTENCREYQHRYQRPLNIDLDGLLSKIEASPPIETYDGPTAIRDSRYLMSAIQSEMQASGRVLDLGCGPRDQAVPIAHLGHKYVGLDYSNKNADILADAHALPFTSNFFDCVLSYAVLEHLHTPVIALSEIERVLKSGGIYIGTVSQGEPFHDSFLHHTAWGLMALINTNPKLSIERLWSSGDTLGSLSRMGRYPRVVKSFIKMIDRAHRAFPFLAPRRMKWSTKQKQLDALYRAGSICFVIKKT